MSCTQTYRGHVVRNNEMKQKSRKGCAPDISYVHHPIQPTAAGATRRHHIAKCCFDRGDIAEGDFDAGPTVARLVFRATSMARQSDALALSGQEPSRRKRAEIGI